MAFAGTHARRSPGVKNAKVKILLNKKGSSRQRLPKAALPIGDETDLQEQSAIYLRERNKQMRAKRLRAEMELAFDRNQLVEKTLVEKQLSYLLVAMRQKLLALPVKLGVRSRRLVARTAASASHGTAKGGRLDRCENEATWRIRGENRA